MNRFSAHRLVAVLGAALLVACSGDDEPVAPPQPPSVGGVSASIVSPGDTLVISGSNFVSPANANTVTFTNPLAVAKAFAGSASSLSVIVDQDATTGAIVVSHEGGSDTGPAVEVRRNIGDYFVFGGLGAGNTLVLPNPTASTRYLVVPHGTNPNVGFEDTLSYYIETTSSLPVAREPVRQFDRAAGAWTDGAAAFDAWRWERAREYVERAGPGADKREPVVQSTAPLQATRQFNVLRTSDPEADLTKASSYQRVTAQLRYTGSRCLVYSDVDTLATGNFSGADLRIIGQAFDNGIDATNIQYFGGYSDIDNNDKAIILITPVVNRLEEESGFISGFFLFLDLLSNYPSGTSNRAEIFYLMAADPNAFWDGTFEVDFARDTNIATTAHEHEHLISFSERVFNQGQALQSTWLEEGMAHMAEDLNNLHEDNKKRAAIYLGNPGAGSLENNGASLHQRGGIYLFLRLMADRYGEEILKDIVQSRCTGRNCIRSVTGRDFYDLLAEFFAALYLEDRGITADPRFDFTSINLSEYGTLAVANRVAGGLDAGLLFRSAARYYAFGGVLGEESEFLFGDDLNNARLRNVIVRVQ